MKTCAFITRQGCGACEAFKGNGILSKSSISTKFYNRKYGYDFDFIMSLITGGKNDGVERWSVINIHSEMEKVDIPGHTGMVRFVKNELTVFSLGNKRGVIRQQTYRKNKDQSLASYRSATIDCDGPLNVSDFKLSDSKWEDIELSYIPKETFLNNYMRFIPMILFYNYPDLDEEIKNLEYFYALSPGLTTSTTIPCGLPARVVLESMPDIIEYITELEENPKLLSPRIDSLKISPPGKYYYTVKK